MGLVPTPEHDWAGESIDTAAQVASDHIDLDAIYELIQDLPPLGATVLAADVSVGQGFLIELVLTFLLANAVLNCAVSGRAGALAGVAIASTLIALILVGGPLTGASLNPARTLGPAVVTGNYSHLWLYFVAPMTGGAAAALLYNGLLKPDE